MSDYPWSTPAHFRSFPIEQKSPPSSVFKGLLRASEGHLTLLERNASLAKRVFTGQMHQPSEVLPGVFTSDPRYLRAMESMAKVLSGKEWQPTVDDSGYSLNYLTGGEDKLLAVSVYRKLPMGVGIEDNSFIRSELPVSEPGDLERAVGDVVSELFWSTRTKGGVSFKKEATTGIPLFEKGAAPKFEALKRCHLVMSSLKLEAVTPSNLLRNGIILVYLILQRIQPDKASKKRYSYTGLGMVEVDPSTPYEGHHGMRVRTVYAASGTYSYFLTTLFAPFRNSYLRKYGFTYKHRTVAEQERKLNGFEHWVGVDVTQFDQSVPKGMLEIFVDGLKYTGYERKVIELVRLTLGAPSISACPYHVSSPSEWGAPGDPYDGSTYDMTRGLPSGHPLNPDIGKFCMTVESICRYLRASGQADKYGDRGVLASLVKTILLGQHKEFGFLNSADDNLWLSSDSVLLKKMVDQKGVFALDLESVPVFLGTVFGREGGYAKGLPNVMSSLVNWYVPEQSLSRRPYHQTAWRERGAFHGRHFMAPELKKIADAAIFAEFSAYPDSMIAARPEPALPFSIVTEVDRMFFNDPTTIHYRISAEDVSPELLASVSATLPEDVVDGLCRAYGSFIYEES